MIAQTSTSMYEVRMEEGKIVMEKIAILAGDSVVKTGEKHEGKSLLITPRGMYLYEDEIPRGDYTYTVGVIKKDEEIFSPSMYTSSLEKVF